MITPLGLSPWPGLAVAHVAMVAHVLHPVARVVVVAIVSAVKAGHAAARLKVRSGLLEIRVAEILWVQRNLRLACSDCFLFNALLDGQL